MNYKRILIFAFLIWTGYIMIQAACTSSTGDVQDSPDPVITQPFDPSDTIGQKNRTGAEFQSQSDTVINQPRKTFGKRMKKEVAKWQQERAFRLESAPDGTIRLVDDGGTYIKLEDLGSALDTTEDVALQAAAMAAIAMNKRGEIGPVDIDAHLEASLTEKSAATAVLKVADIEFMWKGQRLRTWALDGFASERGLEGDRIEQEVANAMICENDPSRGDGMQAAESILNGYGLSFDQYADFFSKMRSKID